MWSEPGGCGSWRTSRCPPSRQAAGSSRRVTPFRDWPRSSPWATSRTALAPWTRPSAPSSPTWNRSRQRLPVEAERTQRMDHTTELPEAAPPRPLVAPTSPRRGAANRIIALHGVSSFCYGLVCPFTGIFLADRPGLGTHGVALYYAVAGVANLAVALVLAMGVVRPPRVALGVIGNLLSFAGYLLLPSVGSLSAVGLAAAANGAGQGCFLAAVIPIVNSLVPEADRRQGFARRHQVLHAALALGPLLAGAAVPPAPR